MYFAFSNSCLQLTCLLKLCMATELRATSLVLLLQMPNWLCFHSVCVCVCVCVCVVCVCVVCVCVCVCEVQMIHHCVSVCKHYYAIINLPTTQPMASDGCQRALRFLAVAQLVHHCISDGCLREHYDFSQWLRWYITAYPSDGMKDTIYY